MSEERAATENSISIEEAIDCADERPQEELAKSNGNLNNICKVLRWIFFLNVGIFSQYTMISMRKFVNS